MNLNLVYSSVDQAAVTGDLEKLKKLQSLYRRFTEKTTAAAALHGQLECLQFLYESKCPWDKQTLHNSIIGDHFACFSFALSNGCVPSKISFTLCAEYGRLSMLILLYEHYPNLEDKNALHVAVRHGHLNCVTYLHESRKFAIPSDIICEAEGKGQTDCLQYLLAHEPAICKEDFGSVAI